MIQVNRLLFLGLSLLVAPTLAVAELTPGPNDLYVRVVDVGPGLCTVVAVPGNHYMVYDAGHWQGKKCIEAVRELIGDHPVELMVISHSDGDHLGDAAGILKDFEVNQIWRTGFERDTSSWKSMNSKIGKETRYDSATVINLRTMTLPPGFSVSIGDATVVFVAGWPKWTAPGPTPSEKRNAISIVVRLDFQGKSILFSGDTVGRRIDEPDTACKDAEKIMVDRHNAGTVSLDADVLIAPHHGGDNGSSACFILAVDPGFVVFSAGHDHHHPTSSAAGRYTSAGVPVNRIFRTDRGDDEGSGEWADR